MKRILFLSLILLPFSAFAQLDPYPARFVGYVEVQAQTEQKVDAGSKAIDKKQFEAITHKKLNENLLASLLQSRAAVFAEIERTASVDSQPLEAGKALVKTQGEVYGHVITAEADRPDLVPVEQWEVRLYDGDLLVATEKSALPEDLLFTVPTFTAGKLTFSKKLTKNLLTAVEDFRDGKGRKHSNYNLRAKLVPMAWVPVTPEHNGDLMKNIPFDFSENIRGRFTLTHRRTPVFEPIEMSIPQTRTLLGIKTRDRIDQCFAWLIGDN